MPIKPWKDLTISDDYMFKLVMRRKHICKRMLERILRFKIRDIRYLEDEKTMKLHYESKGIRLDVYAEADGSAFEIEMQVRNYGIEELAKRTRYYQSAIDQDLLKAGYRYKYLKPCYIIFICPFDLYGLGRHIYTFRNLCVENPSLEMGDATTKIFLNSRGTLEDVPMALKAFLDYINGTVSKDALVQEIENEIHRLKLLEEEEVSYMTYEMKLEEMREEGLKQGLEQGRQTATVQFLKSIMQKLHLSAEEAMDMFDVPASERPKYAGLL